MMGVLACLGLAMVWQMENAKAYNISTPVLQAESFVAEASFRTMLSNASVTTIKTGCWCTGATTATGADDVSRVASISVACEAAPVTATVFIDASYDGDVMVAAGDVDFTAGREAISTYNESYAGKECVEVPFLYGIGVRVYLQQTLLCKQRVGVPCRQLHNTTLPSEHSCITPHCRLSTAVHTMLPCLVTVLTPICWPVLTL